MKAFIILSVVLTVAVAEPGLLAGSPVIAYQLGAPIGLDGRVLDTPEVAQAKAAHFAAHAYEAARNTLGYAPAIAYATAPYGYIHAISYGGAPIGIDGRVVDTPEVAQAKAIHLAAHSKEAAKSAGHPYGALAYAAIPAYAYGYPHTAPIGLDGNVVDTPEVAQAKAAHFAAHHEAKQQQH